MRYFNCETLHIMFPVSYSRAQIPLSGILVNIKRRCWIAPACPPDGRQLSSYRINLGHRNSGFTAVSNRSPPFFKVRPLKTGWSPLQKWGGVKSRILDCSCRDKSGKKKKANEKLLQEDGQFVFKKESSHSGHSKQMLPRKVVLAELHWIFACIQLPACLNADDWSRSQPHEGQNIWVIWVLYSATLRHVQYVLCEGL